MKGLFLFCICIFPSFSALSQDVTPPMPPAFSCAQGQISCANGDGALITGGYDAFTNTFQDLNPVGSGFVAGDNAIIGASNSLSTVDGRNLVEGYDNTASGTLGNLSIIGEDNVVQSNDGNIVITGSGNKVTGSQGENWGMTINGGTNTVDTSSGSITGVRNTVSNMTRGNIFGYLNNVSNSSDSVIMGNGNTQSGNNSVLIGDGSVSTSDNQITIGAGNSNSAAGSTVIGNGGKVEVNATNSVCLGNNCLADRPDTVSVGNDGALGDPVTDRQITNVAAGTAPTDAVNLQQLQDGLSQTLRAANSYTDQRFSVLNTRINQAGAASSALGLVAAAAAGNPSDDRIAMASTMFNSQPAVALGYQHLFHHNAHPITVTFGASLSGSQHVVGGAVSFGF